MTGAAKNRKGNGYGKSSRRGCLIAAAGFVLFAATVGYSDPIPPLPGTVVRTVEVSPGSRKRKAFPLDQGSGMCDLRLDPVNPWRIRQSWIEPQDDQTLWHQVSDYEYQMSYGYAPDEYVVVKGELYKPSAGSGKVPVKLPEFLVTVSKVNIGWDATKHGEAAKEEKEDEMSAVILVSSEPENFGKILVGPVKDDTWGVEDAVVFMWTKPEKVRVTRKGVQYNSGDKVYNVRDKFVEFDVEALDEVSEVKFTVVGMEDITKEKAEDSVKARFVRHEIHSTTKAAYPVDHGRSRVGVGEIVDLSLVPAIDAAWSSSSGEITLVRAIGPRAQLDVGEQEGVLEVQARIMYGVLKKRFSVLAPSGFESARIIQNTSMSPGTQGCELWFNPVVIGPSDVSFANVDFKEIEEEATDLEGDFYTFGIKPPHHPADWGRLDARNSWIDQTCYITQAPLRGSFKWPIPAKWRIHGKTNEHLMKNGWDQRMLISSNGTVRIEKFFLWGERTLNNERHNGEMGGGQ